MVHIHFYHLCLAVLIFPFVLAYDWGSFTSADVIVDVGANVGIVTMMLAKNFKEPQYIIQDLPSVIPQAQAVSHFSLEIINVN